MSLDRSERAATAADLQRNLDASGLSRADLGSWLGLGTDQVDAAFDVDGAHPSTVWYLRDALDRAVRDAGGTPSWTVLTDSAKGMARRWFSLRDVPPRP